MNKSLDALIDSSPHLWRGGRAALAVDGLATGFAELDRALPGSGWPWGAVVELLLPAMGIGEVRLLLPAIVHVTRSRRHVLMIDAPYRPYAPALFAAGIDPDYLLIVSPDSRSDALWSAEKALANRACGIVLLWHDDRRKEARSRIDPHAVRRLQVAAQTGRSLLFLYRRIDPGTTAAVLQHSWAAVRLLLSGGGGDRLGVEILKARGGSSPACITVNLKDVLPLPLGEGWGEGIQ